MAFDRSKLNPGDELRVCKERDCKLEFILPESQILHYRQMGLELPKRCQSCRRKRRIMGITQPPAMYK